MAVGVCPCLWHYYLLLLLLVLVLLCIYLFILKNTPHGQAKEIDGTLCHHSVSLRQTESVVLL